MILLVLNNGASNKHCPDDWTYFPGTKSCYRVFNSAKTWDESKKECLKHNGDLAAVNSAFTNHFLASLTQENSWIGATKDSEGNWKWSDGSILSFTNWGSGQPNNLSEYKDKVSFNYGAVGMWDAAAADNKCPFICQRNSYLFENCASIPVTSTLDNGYKVEPHKFPWQAWIIIDSEDGPSTCGGSLITENHVISSANCVFNKSLEHDYIYVAVGTHDIDKVKKNLANGNMEDIIEISDIKLYPEYVKEKDWKRTSDVAILTLSHNLRKS